MIGAESMPASHQEFDDLSRACVSTPPEAGRGLFEEGRRKRQGSVTVSNPMEPPGGRSLRHAHGEANTVDVLWLRGRRQGGSQGWTIAVTS